MININDDIDNDLIKYLTSQAQLDGDFVLTSSWNLDLSAKISFWRIITSHYLLR